MLRIGTHLEFKRYLAVVAFSFISFFGVVWIWVVQAPLAYLDLNYPAWLGKMILVKEGHLGDLAIVGDSSPCADLVPERLGPSVVNLGLMGATPVEEYFLAKNALAAATPPKAVILSFPPAHFVAPEVFWGYGVGYGLLGWKDVEEVRSRSRALGETSLFDAGSPGDIDARLKAFLYAIKFPSYYFPALVHGRIYGRYAGNAEVLNFVLANNGYATFGQDKGSTKLDANTELKSFVPSKILDDYFDRTIALYHDKNIPVYFISMPRNEASVRVYVPGLKEAFSDYLAKYVQRYPNFHVLGDPLPAYPSRYFGDSSHLNKEGAGIWSDYVAKLLNDAQVPGGPYGAVGDGPSK